MYIYICIYMSYIYANRYIPIHMHTLTYEHTRNYTLAIASAAGPPGTILRNHITEREYGSWLWNYVMELYGRRILRNYITE